MVFNAMLSKSKPGLPYLDTWMGPFGVNRRALRCFLEFTESTDFSTNWDATHLPRLDVIRQDMRVASMDAQMYFYPGEQRRIEEGDIDMMFKRAAQLKLLESYRAHARKIGLID